MSVYSSAWYKQQAAIAKRQNLEHVAKHDRLFSAIMAKSAADGDENDRNRNDGGNASVHPAVQIATLLVASGKFPGHAQALDHLLNTSRGQALLQRMHKADQTTAKENSMDKFETLRDIAKAGGIVAVAKAILDENRSYGISEEEFVELASESAQAEFPLLSKAQAFAKLYENPTIWRACNLLKSMPFQVSLDEPLQVGGFAAQNEAMNNTESSEAYRQLQQIGRDRWPTESEARQFLNAFSEPANAALARKAHVRPSATTSYEFPR